MMNMTSLFLLISVLFQVFVPPFFIPAAYADLAEDYPEWNSSSKKLCLLADGEDSGIVKGVLPGQYIMIFDESRRTFAYNGCDSSCFPVLAEDPCFSEDGYRLTGIGPGYSVEVYPAPEAVSYQDAELFRWKDVFFSCDISPEEDSFSVLPSSALDGSFNGAVSLTPETTGENVYHLEVLSETGELLKGENFVGGLAPGDYMVRVAPEKNILASGWYMFTVEGPAEYQLMIEDVPEEKGSVEAYYLIPEAAPPEVPLSSGSFLRAGETVYVSVTALEGYELTGIDLTPEGGTSTRLLPEEAEDGVFSFVMPASPLKVSAVINAVQEPDPPSGEGNEEDPPDDDGDNTDDPDEDEDISNSITAVIFSKKEDTVFLSEGEQFYYYTLIPEDPDGTLLWSRTPEDSIADIIIDPEQRVISVTPRKAGSFTLTVVVKENKEIRDGLTINVVDDTDADQESFASCRFTYATEDGVWFYDLPGAFSLRCSAPASMLVEVRVDGQVIPQYNSEYLNWYLSDTKDTAVNFSSEFMSSLSHGNHCFKFVYTNGGCVSRSVSIQSKYSPPKTGDEQKLTLCCALLSFSAVIAAGLFIKIRKKQ